MLRTLTALAATCALAVAPPCAATGVFGPAGPEFEITSAANQIRIATGSNGHVFTLWGDGPVVWARLYDDVGRPLGPPQMVPRPSYTYGYVHDAHVAAGPNTFVATFTLNGYYSNYVLAYAVYTGDGDLIHNGIVSPTQFVESALAVGSEGDFLVGWPATGEKALELHARLFEATGGYIGGHFVLATNGGHAHDLVLARDRDGGYLARWSEYHNEDRDLHYVQRLDSLGAPAGDLIPLSGRAALCANAEGGFVAAWSTPGAEPHALWMQRYGPDDTPLDNPQRVDTEAPISALPPALACAADGAVVVVWEACCPDELNIFAHRYNASGAPAGPVFRVNEPTAGEQCFPTVSGNGDGNFTVAWVDVRGTIKAHARGYHIHPTARVKGDFDRDGRPDLVLRRIHDGQVHVWTMHEGTRTGHVYVRPQTPDWKWHLGGVDDFNADGHADLVFRHLATGEVDIWLLGGEWGGDCIGRAVFKAAPNLPAEWMIVATTDFDGDDRPDVLWRNRDTGKLAVWLLDGMRFRATLIPTPDHAADLGWIVVGAGDLNGDGWSDLLWYNTDSGRIAQWLLDATLTRMRGRFTDPIQSGGPAWDVGAVADLGFGLLGQAGSSDILLRDATTGEFLLWFMDTGGASTAITHTTPPAPEDPLAWTVVGPR